MYIRYLDQWPCEFNHDKRTLSKTFHVFYILPMSVSVCQCKFVLLILE